MPDTEKKEPGRSTVQQKERGDPRQHERPIDKPKDTSRGTAQDQPPASSDRSDESPWLGGG